jgi:hypothetical protein
MADKLERVRKMQGIANQLKRETSNPSVLGRPQPLIIYHPSRLPNTEEFTALFRASTGEAVEHDVRACMGGSYSIQQGMYTDRLMGWGRLSTLDDLRKVFGSELESISNDIKVRTKNDGPMTFENIKANLLVKDLTFQELKNLARVGGEEILEVREFLDLYKKEKTMQDTAPGKLTIDFKDSDGTISGGVEIAVQAMEVVVEEIRARSLDQDVHSVLVYSIPALEMAKRIFEATARCSGALPSDLIKKQGEGAFASYAESLVVNYGADSITLKIGELPIIKGVIDAKKPAIQIYVPPKESEDINLIIQTLRVYPTIEAVQIDA